MTSVEVQYSLAELSATLVKYAAVVDKTEGEIIAKQSDKLGFFLKQGLRKLAPDKGAVRVERIAALRAGEGIHVRNSVYQKLMGLKGISQDVTTKGYKFGQRSSGAKAGLNFQALAVKAELGLRESGRGFMGYSSPRGKSYAEVAHYEVQGRYGPILSSFDINVEKEAPNKFARFTWQSDSPALEGLNAEQQMAVINSAVQETNADIMEYVNRKMEDAKNGILG